MTNKEDKLDIIFQKQIQFQEKLGNIKKRGLGSHLICKDIKTLKQIKVSGEILHEYILL